MAQPYKFRLILKNGDIVNGGAESIGLAIDHVRHCLRCPIGDNPPVKGYYLGKYGRNENPVEVLNDS